MEKTDFYALLASSALLLTSPALAQRTDDNAATAAEDAFGTSVGDQSIGIYSSGDVRGFSPSDAGNIRLEGLYFDQQAFLTDRLQQGSTIRVGISAQSYPFPAPTGIADYNLRKPGAKRLASVGLNYGPFGGKSAEIDLQLPIDGARFGIAAGAGLYRETSFHGGSPNFFSTALVSRFAPRDGVEVTGFWSRVRVSEEEAQPLIFNGGTALPKRIARASFHGQPWADNSGTETNYGVIARADPLGFDVRLGVFRSISNSDESFADLLFDTDANGVVGNRFIIREAGSRSASTSGELRASRTFADGPRQHILIASLRARDQSRLYGGSNTQRLERTSFSDRPDFRARPVFTEGPKSTDGVKQTTFGAAYQGKWRNVGEISLGVQKTRYTKTTVDPARSVPSTKDSPFLFSATAAVYVTPSLAIYGGYTRGLEESPRAPDEAINRNEAPPAIRTEQKDAGVRWTISKGVTAVVGVFDVAKPYFGTDKAKLFRQLGSVRNRGVELSIAGQIAPGLNLVAGNVFLDAEISGENVTNRVIGKRPIGTIERRTIISLDYRLPWHDPLSLDAFFESTGNRIANDDPITPLIIPPRSVISLGARYRLKVDKTPVLIRAQVGNVTNTFGWLVGGSGFFIPNGARRFSLSIAADI
jgi:iron complex outermembrane recepter protein